MKKVTYLVGNEKITSFAQATARAKEMGLTIKTLHEEVAETSKKDLELALKRRNALGFK